MKHRLSRRKVLAAGAATGVAVAARSVATVRSTEVAPRAKGLFTMCLNTSTISGQKLGIEKEIEIAAAAGFEAIEPWIRELIEFQKAGGSLKDLGKKIRDAGMTVPSAIGFAAWIADDDAQRAKGMEEMKRDMDVVAQIGGSRIAAPAAGLGRDAPPVDLRRAAERYGAVCELGKQFNVVPMVEIWGPSKTLQKLGDGVMVAMNSNRPEA
jgi:2-keto-myo-inositol isomerase